MHYLNTAFNFGGNYLLEKGKYVVIESSVYENKILLTYCSFSFFLKDNKLAVVLKLLTVLKLVSAIFYQFFIFSANGSSLKSMKNVFISSRKLFSFLRYSNFCDFPSLPHFPD